MALLIYTFNFRFDGRIAYSAKHEFIDDLDALDTAEKFTVDFEIEVFNGDRFVARINKGGRALNTQDARSG